MKEFNIKTQVPATATWVVTFADLMTLLLTFFILLLSFSELDAKKYRSIAYSMSQAFGVSWAPQSQLAPSIAPVLPIPGSDEKETVTQPEEPHSARSAEALSREPMAMTVAQSRQQLANAALGHNDALATALISQLEQQVAEQVLDITFDEKGVIISFTERSSFSSGSVELKQYMHPVLLKVVDELVNCSGDILVMGHTDDRPMDSGRFRSNWDLSAARAVSVVHQLVLDGRLDARRVRAAGLAETQPLVPNTSAENRAKNRRVEILVENAICKFAQ